MSQQIKKTNRRKLARIKNAKVIYIYESINFVLMMLMVSQVVAEQREKQKQNSVLNDDGMIRRVYNHRREDQVNRKSIYL
jgi:hypothetical protein